MADTEQRYRLVVLGSGKVGKSSIVRRLLKNDFSETYRPTIEDLHCRDYDVGGTTIKVDILDTAGNLEFPAMRRLSISTAHAFLLVYAVDDRDSFDEVRQLWEQIREQRTSYQELPCVVAGNKIDLEAPRQRHVSTDEVRQWAASTGLPESALIEVSAREGTEVTAIFYRLLSQAANPSTVLRRLEPLVRRRLSGNAARMSPHRARLREKEAAGKSASTGPVEVNEPEGGSSKFSRSRSLIRRVSKPKVKRSMESSPRDDCVVS